MPASPVPRSVTPAAGEFLLCACQAGAERALQALAGRRLPGARPAAWRRGLVTLRLGPGRDRAVDACPDLALARALAWSLGQVSGPDATACARAVRTAAGPARFDALHVWSRDPRGAAATASVRAAVAEACDLASAREVALPGDLVLDCVIDEPGRWWVGWHRAAAPSSCWPGGLYPGVLPPAAVSRAWLKLDEAIAAFAIPFGAGERAIELGAAPGGACQRLLAAGLTVVAVDPALVAPAVANLPGFTQWRMRAREVPLKRLAGFDWIVCDMNIDPRSTLAALERVVTARGVRPRGIVATLKLPDWSRTGELSDWLERFRGWGFRPRARQLSSAGREVCVVALAAGSSARSSAGASAGASAVASAGVARPRRRSVSRRPSRRRAGP